MEQNNEAIQQIVKSSEQAWKTGNGAGFAAPFAEDADYVIVNGVYMNGRAAIDHGHQQIFDTVYKGSTNQFTLERVRFIRPDVAIVHVHAHLKFHDGENMRESKARSTSVLTKEEGKWSIAAFQNTPITVPSE